MLRITDEQRALLMRYLPWAEIMIVENDISGLLDKLDDRIMMIGFNRNYELNKVGLMLQHLYDEIYYQNTDENGAYSEEQTMEMIRYPYEYTVSFEMDDAVFNSVCRALEDYTDYLIREYTITDVDGSRTRVYRRLGKKIVVHNSYQVGCVYVESEVDLSASLTGRRGFGILVESGSINGGKDPS